MRVEVELKHGSHERATKKKERKTREISLRPCRALLVWSPEPSRRDGGDLSRDPGLRRRVPADAGRCFGGGAAEGGSGSGGGGGESGGDRAQGAGSGGREARAVGVPRVPRGGQGHLRQSPLAAARRPAHRHRRPRPRRPGHPWPLLEEGINLSLSELPGPEIGWVDGSGASCSSSLVSSNLQAIMLRTCVCHGSLLLY